MCYYLPLSGGLSNTKPKEKTMFAFTILDSVKTAIKSAGISLPELGKAIEGLLTSAGEAGVREVTQVRVTVSKDAVKFRDTGAGKSELKRTSLTASGDAVANFMHWHTLHQKATVFGEYTIELPPKLAEVLTEHFAAKKAAK